MAESLQDIVLKEVSSYLKIQVNGLSLDARLEDLGIDSLGAITILYELEDKLGIEVPNEVLESMRTVGDILIQLQKLISLKSTT